MRPHMRAHTRCTRGPLPAAAELWKRGQVTQDPFAPRKSGRQSRARETIEAILQASVQIVSRQGISRLTTNHIAELAGVSIGSLYQYFPGKDAVLQALVEREFNRAVDAFVARIDAIDPAAVPLDDAIALMVDRVLDEQIRSRPLYRQLLLTALSWKHLRFTLDNDARVLGAVRAKLVAYPEVDREALDLATFVVLYALKGVQLGVALSDEHAADDGRLRSLLCRLVRACLVRGSTA